MKKILLCLFLVLIALMGVASVSACDVGNYTIDYSQQADFDNVSTVDALIVNEDSANLDNVSTFDYSQQDLENNISSKDLNDDERLNSSVCDNISVNKSVFFKNSTFACGNSTCGNLTEDSGKIGNESSELENTSSIFKTAFKKVKNACVSVFDSVKDFCSSVYHSISNFFDKVGDAIMKAYNYITLAWFIIYNFPQIVLDIYLIFH